MPKPMRYITVIMCMGVDVFDAISVTLLTALETVVSKQSGLIPFELVSYHFTKIAYINRSRDKKVRRQGSRYTTIVRFRFDLS